MTNRTMWKILMAKLVIWGLLLSSACIALLAIYGGVQLYDRTKRHQQLEDHKFEINHLQTQVFHLRDLNDYAPILEQLLTPLQLAELKVLSEQIRQQKNKNYERHEQPILTDKERKLIRKIP